MSKRAHPATALQAREFVALLDGFDALAGPRDEIGDFAALLTEFEPTLAAEVSAARVEFSLDEARDFFDSFDTKWRAYLEEDAENSSILNIWRIADLGIDEVRNCRVLKWLLDPGETHCQGVRFLNCLLEAIGEPLVDEASRIQVRREVSMAEGHSRVDIMIESRSTVLLIEAKIRAEEDMDQLKRHSGGAQQRIHGRRFIGKLLTEQGTSGEALVAGFTRLLWSDVAGALRRFGRNDEEVSSFRAENSFVARLALQYADFIHSHFKSRE